MAEQKIAVVAGANVCEPTGVVAYSYAAQTGLMADDVQAVPLKRGHSAAKGVHYAGVAELVERPE